MLCKNGLGIGTLARRIGTPRERFFSLFYEWSSLRSVRHIHQHPQKLLIPKSDRGNVSTKRFYTCTASLHESERENRISMKDSESNTTPIESLPFDIKLLDPDDGVEVPQEINGGPQEPNDRSMLVEQPKKPNDIPQGNEGACLAHPLRQLMRNMPHSVVVVTSSSNTEDNSQRYKGMTISSFTTLTLSPSPIITFNIKTPSSTLSAIQESKQFLVHLLQANKFGARVADAFTKGKQEEKFVNQASNVFVEAGSGPLEAPRLKEHGVLKIIKCRLLEEGEGGGVEGGLVKVGDHVIVLGKVVELFHGDSGKLRGKDEWSGLCYLHGKYMAQGSEIKVKK